MKKEIFSICLLVFLLTATLLNIRGVRAVTDELKEYVTVCAEYISLDDWLQAERYAQLAKKLWDEKDTYTHMVLRHSEIDTVSDALYDFTGDVYERNAEASRAGAEKIIYHLDSICDMERVRFGSVF